MQRTTQNPAMKSIHRAMCLVFVTVVNAFNLGMSLVGAIWKGYDKYYFFATVVYAVLTITMGFFTYIAVMRLGTSRQA